MLHPVQNKLLQNLYDDLVDLFADKDEETAQMGFAFQGVGIYEHSELNQIKITYAGVGYEYLSPKALAGGILRGRLHEIAKDNGFVIENLSEFCDVFHLAN